LTGHGCINENANTTSITPPNDDETSPAVEEEAAPACTNFKGTPIGEWDPEYSEHNNYIGNYHGGDIVTWDGCEFEARFDTIQEPQKFRVSDWNRSDCCIVNCNDAPPYDSF